MQPRKTCHHLAGTDDCQGGQERRKVCPRVREGLLALGRQLPALGTVPLGPGSSSPSQGEVHGSARRPGLFNVQSQWNWETAVW